MMAGQGQNYHVTEGEVGLTVIQGLRRWLPAQSWSQLRKLISGCQVQMNGNLCRDEGRRLKANDVVKVLAHAQSAPPTIGDVKIQYLDAQVVVVEKPSGMTTLRHAEERNWPARRKQLQPTLDEVLPRLIEQQSGGRPKAGGKKKPPGKHKPGRIRPVHRIDRDTSGLLVFARTPEAEQKLIQQFRKHTTHRIYWAVVHGTIEAQTFESHLVRDRGDGHRGSTTLPDTGQRAVTHIRPIEPLGDYTLIECQLETGRTHQIRIHLSEAGHMLCGEKTYDQPLFKKKVPDTSHAPRLALHARELGFVHPVTGEELKFQMGLPPDLARFVDRLRQEAKGKKAPRES
ncbi:MAG: RluA family pseudouridine synthase [Planctomycetales bacterium]